MWLLAGCGAIVAGLFLCLRELLPWLAAKRTGVIRTRSAKAEEVSREAEPDRYASLMSKRLKAAWPGLLFVLGGAVWLTYNWFGFLVMQR